MAPPNIFCNDNIIIVLIKVYASWLLSRMNNQRNDYMTAYENQMLEIKKELRQLQEKVLEIANDRWETHLSCEVVLPTITELIILLKKFRTLKKVLYILT